MEIEHRVRMGEDRDAVQDELESEPSSNSNDGEEYEEEESDESMFLIGPRDAGRQGQWRPPGHLPVPLR
jgi:hypothetical protein